MPNYTASSKVTSSMKRLIIVGTQAYFVQQA